MKEINILITDIDIFVFEIIHIVLFYCHLLHLRRHVELKLSLFNNFVFNDGYRCEIKHAYLFSSTIKWPTLYIVERFRPKIKRKIYHLFCDNELKSELF